MDMTNFAEGKGFFFLLLNATIVWSIIAGGLLYLLRFKSLLIAIIISPFIIAPAFRGINGIPEALNIYATSIIYGILGILIGIIYVDYTRIKKYFKGTSKLAFIARMGIAFSSIYLISYMGREIIFNNPMVKFALGFISGGNKAQELISSVDREGVETSIITIVICGSFLVFNRYRQESILQKEAKEKALEKAVEKIEIIPKLDIKELEKHE